MGDGKTSGDGSSNPFRGGNMSKTDKGNDFVKNPGGTKIGSGHDFIADPKGDSPMPKGPDFTNPEDAMIGEQKSGELPSTCPESIPSGGKMPFQPGTTEVGGKRASQQHVQTSPSAPAHKPFRLGK
jgi:hypothetical protein